MFFKKKTVVYLSSDESDYYEAKKLLDHEMVRYYEFVAEEMPVCGCGARINPARLNNHHDVMVYRLSVLAEDVQKALEILLGKVKFAVTEENR